MFLRHNREPLVRYDLNVYIIASDPRSLLVHVLEIVSVKIDEFGNCLSDGAACSLLKIRLHLI